MKKAFVSLLVLCLMVTGLSGLSMAGIITPFWTYTSQVTPSLGFQGRFAYSRIDVVCSSSVYRIEGTLKLDEELVANIWVTQDSWSVDKQSNSVVYAAPGVRTIAGKRYRVTFTGTVYSTKGTEPIYGEIIQAAP